MINDLNNEDKIKSVFARITELESYCNILCSALDNEFDSISNDDIKNSLLILKDYIIKLKYETNNYISCCESSGMFNNSGN